MTDKDLWQGVAGVLRLSLLVICLAGLGWAAGWAFWTVFQ
jgi:hypothetical protein